MSTLRTALVIEVPEAAEAVADIRRELDPYALRGVPPHITLTFPFIPVAQLVDDDLNRLAGLWSAFPEFEHALVDTAWFGDDVLWLATDGDAVVRSMTDAVTKAFPQHPPYEGKFEDVVPHLTIAERGSRAAMQTAQAAVRSQLPIRVHTQDVTLLEEEPSGMWVRRTSFALMDGSLDPGEQLGLSPQ